MPIYAEHVRCGKVVGTANPVVRQPKPGAVIVDAENGFAHPAIDAGYDALTSRRSRKRRRCFNNP